MGAHIIAAAAPPSRRKTRDESKEGENQQYQAGALWRILEKEIKFFSDAVPSRLNQ